MPQPIDTSRTGAGAQLDEAFYAARSLEPNDRLRLIARLWASLPRHHWAAPSDSDLDELERRLNQFDTSELDAAPWKILRRVSGNYPDPLKPTIKLYSAPRRFDLFTIMIVTAAYAVLLSGMNALRFPPIVSFFVAAFITMVGIGQAALFGGRQPRLASAVSGAVAYFLCWLFFALMNPRWDIAFMIIPGLLLSAIAGSPLGYLAGVLVGGVFLVADVLRQRYGKETVDDGSARANPSRFDSESSVHPLDNVPSATHQ
jgi:putative addiction module component (TIGR02574 family)